MGWQAAGIPAGRGARRGRGLARAAAGACPRASVTAGRGRRPGRPRCSRRRWRRGRTGGLYEGADTDALVGIARQWAAVESWAAAGMLGALRAMMREDSDGQAAAAPPQRPARGVGRFPELRDRRRPRHGAGVGGEPRGPGLDAGHPAAGHRPLLADGTLTLAKAKLVVEMFEPLDEDEAARAEALVLGELAGKTYFQVERLAWRAAAGGGAGRGGAAAGGGGAGAGAGDGVP